MPEVDPPLPALTVPQLSYLVAVASSTTFAEAAASLGVTTSALSQGISELERRIGIDLFERVGRRQVLRPEATEVVAYARRVVADTSDLARWAARARAGTTGRLRVGLIDAAAVVHFPAQLRAFRRANPDVELRLVVAPSGELLDQLWSGGLDVAVVVEPPTAGRGARALAVAGGAARGGGARGPRGGAAGGAGDPGCCSPAARTPAPPSSASCGRSVRRSRSWPSPTSPRCCGRWPGLGVGWTVLPEAQARSGPRSGPTKGLGPVLTTRRLVVARRAGRVEQPAADRFVAALRA